MWELDYNESWAPKNWCFWTVVLEKTLESPLDCKKIQPVHFRGICPVHWKDWCWSWDSNTLATWCEELTHLKRPWCWERLRAGGEGDRGWGGWMASPTQWSWVWVNSGSWWWTRKPGILRRVAKCQTPLSDWTELDKTRKKRGTVYKRISSVNKRLRFLIWPILPRTLLNHILMWLHDSRAR